MSSNLTNPFKGLQPYSRADGEKLFGRDSDLILVKDRIFSGRTTLLFAGSGVGKTSFLNAKVIPELENQYCTFYHNRWAGPSKPLDAVKDTLAEKIEVARKGGPLLDIFRQFNEAPPQDSLTSLSDSDSISPHRQYLLIFDQFEEIFQYHAYEDYFKHFLYELCDVIRKEEYRVHVFFSMREEFLGELSVFDNLIPDLFNNYYRLKYPDTREAKRIIEGTCRIADTTVDGENLTQLIRDLSRIEKGAAGAAERSTGGGKATDHVIERNFIIPPYLQIVCHRHWEQQAANATDAGKDNFIFLEDYRPNQAQKMLNDFCQEKLSALSFIEQDLAAQSFDFLVTKQGAKMAYEFTSLADHMRIRFFKGKLKHALEKLSAYETRILRRSHGPDGSIWFELYHDIYGKILDTWRQSFRKRKQRVAIGISLAAMALLLILIPVTLHWAAYPYNYRRILRNARLEQPDEYVKAKAAFESLSGTFGYQSSANALWAQAWVRRARYAESHNKRDEAIISWLQALSFEPDRAVADRLRLKVGYLTDGSYRMLRASLHHENKIAEAYFSADGRIAVTQSIDQKMWLWDGRTGAQIGKYSSLPSTQASASVETGKAKPTGTPTDQVSSPESGEGGGTQPSTQEAATMPGRLAQQQYYVRATALHPELGWLVAAISTDYRQRPSSRYYSTERAEYHEFSISILSTVGEIQRLPILKMRVDSSLLYNIQVAFSPDGKYIVAGGEGQPFRAWKYAEKRYVPADGFTNAGFITQAAFSPDGRSLLTVNNNQLSIWDVGSGKLRYQPIPVPGWVKSKFSSDGSFFISHSALEEKTLIQVWNTATGKPVRTPISFDNDDHTFSDIALNSDGRILLAQPSNSRVHLIDLQSGKLQENFKVYSGREAVPLYFSPNGEMVLTYKDNEARLLKASPRRPQGKMLNTGEPVNWPLLLADGKAIVTVSAQPRQVKKSFSSPGVSRTFIIRLWDAETMAPLGEPISDVITLSNDGEYVLRQVQSKRPSQVQILSTRTGAEVARFPSSVDDMLVLFFASPGGKFFAIYSYRQGVLGLWEHGETSRPLFQSPVGSDTSISPVFSPDERFIAFASERSDAVEVWDLATKQSIPLSNNLASATSLSFNKQMRLIAGGTRVARIWDVTSRQQLYNDLEAGAKFSKVELSPDGKTALTGEENGTESLWKFADNGIGSPIGDPVKHGDSIRSASFSGDGKTAVITAGDWLHTINVNDNVYENSYFLDQPFSNCKSLNESGSHFRCVIQLQDNLYKVEDLQSGEITGASAIEGEPGELLKLWQSQLGLNINRVGLMVPAEVSAVSSSGDQP